MSVAFYTRMAATGLRLLTKYGQQVTFIRTTGESIDPVTGVVTPGTDTTATPYGVLLNYKDDMIDGTRILMGDRLLCSDSTYEPLQGDLVTIDGENWNIISIKTMKPSQTAVVYFTQVRK